MSRIDPGDQVSVERITAMTVQTEARVQQELLYDFCLRALRLVGATKREARITAEVLVAADLRGIPSHGVARLRRYIHGIQTGMMRVNAQYQIVRETETTAVIDAGGGLGPPAAQESMHMARRKALEYGSSTVATCNSNHFAIAGFWAEQALEDDCISLVMTNTAPLVPPTFGRQPILGTNALALAFPTGEQRPVIIDMATSTVPRGKVEVCDRLDQPLPKGWAVDHNGLPTDNARLVLDNLKERAGGGLLPLGGAYEEQGGHKGYGLALAVEILCAILSGAAFGTNTYPKDPSGNPLPANLGHTFCVWHVEAFRPIGEFQAAMDQLILMLTESAKAEGQDRIWIHGEKEAEAAERNARHGIDLDPVVKEDLKQLASELGILYGLE